jgi:hypothetical protein
MERERLEDLRGKIGRIGNGKGKIGGFEAQNLEESEIERERLEDLRRTDWKNRE